MQTAIAAPRRPARSAQHEGASSSATGAVSRVALLLVLVLAGVGAHAQDYPTKPVRAVVGYPPGGTVDIHARVIGQRLAELWGQPFIVDNKGGGGSTIGTAFVAQAAADGYTILVASPAHAINATLYTKLPYDTATAFAAVTQLTSTPQIVYAHPSLPVKSIAELVAFAKSKPKALNVGYGGNGTSVHLAAVLFGMVSGTQVTLVPYQGGGPAAAGVLAGDTHIMFSAPEYMTHVKSGKLKALAVTTARRSPMFPDVPTMAESGLPGYDVETWIGVYVPAATPPAIVRKLSADMIRAAQTPDIRERLAKNGFTVVASTPEQFSAFTKEELDKWRRVIAEAKIKNE